MVNGATYNEVHANINDSDIKVKIDNWYEDNLKDNYSRYLDFESGFCNDREVKSIGSLTGNGVAQNNTSYAPYFRVSTVGSAIQASNVQTATLKCTQINNDMLIYKKASGTKGSKVLKYPIGLITMDEILLAGGKYWDYNTKFYLYNNKSYWTMSPAFLAPYSTHIMYLQDSGYLNTTDVSGSNGIRPVVNLRSDTPLIGLGTIESPYVIEGVE